MLRRGIQVAVLALLTCGLIDPVFAVRGQPTPSVLATDGYIVKFKTSASRVAQSNALTTAGVRTIERFALVDGLSHVDIVAGQNSTNAVGILTSNPSIEYIEPNYLVSVARTPNDPEFSMQYALDNQGQSGGMANADINATQAWDIHTGNNVTIAVIDSGLDYNHPDISKNVWTNANEIPGNGIDDDNNGFVDDIRGWDFANNDNDPSDDHGHGT
ncbi:MAG: S8 family serine peptidase, partial [Gammaproteobacteria bacterium]|nr:S8 family serine peptidase [Gammaproteobacteria bacterium]